MGHVIKYKNKYSDTDYLILHRVVDQTKADDLLRLFDAKLHLHAYVHKMQHYNQQCLIVWYTKHKDPNVKYLGPIYYLEMPDGGAYKLLGNVYDGATSSVYELISALKGTHITKKDVSDFANKVKSIKET